MPTSPGPSGRSLRRRLRRLGAATRSRLPGFRSAAPRRNVLVAFVYLLVVLLLVSVAAGIAAPTTAAVPA